MLGRFVVRRVIAATLVLFAITYVAFFTQDIAARQRALQPAPFAEVGAEAWQQTVEMWKGIPTGDLGEYYTSGWWTGGAVAPITDLIKRSLWNSSALLLLSMALGGVVGGLLGIGVAAFRRRSVSLSLLLLSIVGVSTPSFFLAMLLQFGAIQFYKATGTRLLPVGGFGWDSHMVLPILVLAARPIAQVARLTSVYLENLINEDFVRTARSKGLTNTEVWFRHILPNAAGTVLTAMATSLRFALSSLPVVELFFGWPGLGRHLLERLDRQDAPAAAALVLATGFFFVVVNGAVDFLYRVLDPRLRKAETVASAQMESVNWLELAWSGFVRAVTLKGLRERRQKREEIDPLPVDVRIAEESEAEMSRLARSMRWGRMRAWRKATVGNPALTMGILLGLALLVVIVAGPQLAPHDPYITHTRVEIDGVFHTPPIPPSPSFPLGTDAQGRDILSLLLVGASRTIMLALMAVAGRIAIGAVFGFLAGWFHDSLLDRALMAVGEMVNSFPALLLATLVVYAVGVRQGLYAFVFGLLVIGWPEVMQNVRAQVLAVRPMAYIEGAVATGTGQAQILTRHVLPNIWPTIVSLAFLEMGGALMILGELGFLGVFIGGGFAAEGQALPTLYYYDIPEWGVMLANSWRSFRSFPWAMIYPALAFMIAIVTFTLLGEGLRRMAEELTLSMKALFNKYTFAAAAVVALVAWWGFQSTGIWARHKPLAETFSAERAMQDVATLASPQFEGRRMGTPGGEAAAEWIARQFEELGLVTAGEDWTYFQTIRTQTATITEPSRLQAWDIGGSAVPLEWGRDYSERPSLRPREGDVVGGDVVYASGKGLDYFNVSAVREALGVSEQEAQRRDKVLLLERKDSEIGMLMLNLFSSNRVIAVPSSAVLIIDDEAASVPRHELPGIATGTSDTSSIIKGPPVFYITSEAADRLLAGSGHTLTQLRQQSAALQDGEGFYVQTGAQMEVHLSPVVQKDTTYRNVLAIWPGEDIVLDEELIAISAYYDGLGTFGGALYPGANDNASGAATMLEVIRSWKEWGFRPKRSILFAAWAGGELNQMPSITRYLGARPGMENLSIIATFEVEGVGAGEGDAALLWRSSSERVSGMVQTAARKLGLPLTTSGAGLHSAKLSTFEVQSAYPVLNLGWPGADATAHLPTDTPDTLDPNKIGSVGRILSLVASVMASDPAY